MYSRLVAGAGSLLLGGGAVFSYTRKSHNSKMQLIATHAIELAKTHLTEDPNALKEYRRICSKVLEQKLEDGKIPQRGVEVKLPDNSENISYFSLVLRNEFPKTNSSLCCFFLQTGPDTYRVATDYDGEPCKRVEVKV
ncbi:MAG: hypothetical protein SNF33_07060 [Candidatus Algichlamydia australiensis]|nr:hypothetical protein [Chlamydiales bacterium]